MCVRGKMALSGDTEIELSLSQKLYLEEVSGSLGRKSEAFPEELTLGSKPRVDYDEEQTVMATLELEGSLNGLYEAFNIGRPFELALAESYLWVEDDA